jgi:hypothetical protein
VPSVWEGGWGGGGGVPVPALSSRQTGLAGLRDVTRTAAVPDRTVHQLSSTGRPDGSGEGGRP